MTGREHEAVLLEEAVTALAIRPDGRYVDATFGRGGHSRAILERLGPAGELLAFDRDADAVASAGKQWTEEKRFTIVHRPFSQLTSVLDDRGWRGQVQGILFDLGVSSPQLDNPERGFSFRLDGPLDMRMDVTRGESAADWLARAEESEIADVIYQLGEERYSRRIARAIVAARRETPITTTGQLSAIVAGAVPTRERRKDPATRTFQALRLHVNRELDEIRDALPQALAALAPGGRLVVISFHSLEDRIVKNFMRDEARPAEGAPRLRLLGKQRPSDAEVARNPRARSAMLRVAEVLTHA